MARKENMDSEKVNGVIKFVGKAVLNNLLGLILEPATAGYQVSKFPGLKRLRRGVGKTLRDECGNCHCQRYAPCGCRKRKKK